MKSILSINVLIIVIAFMPVVYYIIKIRLLRCNKLPAFRTKLIESNVKFKYIPFKMTTVSTSKIKIEDYVKFHNNVCSMKIAEYDDIDKQRSSFDIILCQQLTLFYNKKSEDKSFLHHGIILNERFKSFIMRNKIPIHIFVTTYLEKDMRLKIYFSVPKDKFSKMKLMGFFDNLDGIQQ